MPHLTLNLLGPMQIMLDRDDVAFRSDKERALLAFLAVEADRPHRREALTGLLYPDREQTQAQNNLRKTLFRLRAALGEKENTAGYLVVTPKTVQFNSPSSCTLDVFEFRASIEPTRRHKHRRTETCAICARNWERAAELYRGEFLAGFNCSGSDAFEEWAVVTRERLHQMALDAMQDLCAFQLHRRDWEQVVRRARRLLELEVWREPAHRALMMAYAAQGKRAAALVQYESCKRILADQFAAEPERETRVLAEIIRSGAFASAESPVSNLPPQLTPLIGRIRELEILQARLLDPEQRLHTIVGPGGMGKTRLALAIAERVASDFRDGAFFVTLAGIRADTPNPNDLIATAIAAALNVTFSGSIAPARQLQTFLRAKELLLVLDNLEQLMASVPWLVELVTKAPRITLLVTSREPLNLQAESVFRLEGLGNEVHGAPGESVRFFVERASRASGQFISTQQALEQVGAICQRLDGMPLALELAAAWTRTRTLDEIVQALSSLDFLATTRRDIPERHASLRAVWQASWDLLTAREQEILGATVVFHGGFDDSAAQMIISAQRALLDRLTDKSLLKRNKSGRYELHDLLGQFVSEQRVKSPEAILKKHCLYFLNYTATRAANLENSEPEVILGEIHRELDNLRAAWRNALENGWYDILTPRVVQGVSTFYYLTGLFREGLSLVERASTLTPATESERPLSPYLHLARARFLERLARYGEASQELDLLLASSDLPDEVRAGAHLRAGWIHYWTGNLAAGRAVLQNTLSWADAHHETVLEADALYVAGLIEQSAADIERAREFYERALELYRAAHNRYGECSALVNLADIAVDQTRLDVALRYGTDALALATKIGKRFDQAAANVILGSFFFELGSFTRAAPYYAESLRLFREMGNGTGESITLRDLAMLSLRRGALNEAFTYAGEAVRVAHEVGSLYREGMTHCVMGELYLARRDFARAEESYLRSMEMLKRAERGHRALDARAGLVRVAQQRGDLKGAQERVQELLDTFDAQNFYDSTDPSMVYAICYNVLVDYDPARARDLLARGHRDLQARAGQIRDHALQLEFLENNHGARALRQLPGQDQIPSAG